MKLRRKSKFRINLPSRKRYSLRQTAERKRLAAEKSKPVVPPKRGRPRSRPIQAPVERELTKQQVRKDKPRGKSLPKIRQVTEKILTKIEAEKKRKAEEEAGKAAEEEPRLDDDDLIEQLIEDDAGLNAERLAKKKEAKFSKLTSE